MEAISKAVDLELTPDGGPSSQNLWNEVSLSVSVSSARRRIPRAPTPTILSACLQMRYAIPPCSLLRVPATWHDLGEMSQSLSNGPPPEDRVEVCRPIVSLSVCSGSNGHPSLAALIPQLCFSVPMRWKRSVPDFFDANSCHRSLSFDELGTLSQLKV